MSCCKAKDELDEFGYSNYQKQSLVEFWATKMQDNLEIHGKNIFIKFLKDYPEYYSFWKMQPDADIMMAEDLPLHGQVAMYGLDRLMRDLQVGADAYRKSISKLVAKHIELHVDLLSIQRYTYTTMRYFQRTFSQDILPEVESALRIFFGLIHHYAEGTINNMTREKSITTPQV